MKDFYNESFGIEVDVCAQNAIKKARLNKFECDVVRPNQIAKKKELNSKSPWMNKVFLRMVNVVRRQWVNTLVLSITVYPITSHFSEQKKCKISIELLMIHAWNCTVSSSDDQTQRMHKFFRATISSIDVSRSLPGGKVKRKKYGKWKFKKEAIIIFLRKRRRNDARRPSSSYPNKKRQTSPARAACFESNKIGIDEIHRYSMSCDTPLIQWPVKNEHL